MSGAAVLAKTGKTWMEWFAILDAAGAKRMTHQQIVAHLSDKHGLAAWWRQMLTVGYEQERGMRQKHQKPEGYQISVSRTLAAPVTRLYKAWQDEKTRSRWLRETPLLIRKATAGKSMRITWKDDKSSLDVNFYPKDDAKTQVVVQHSKLSDAKAAARMKVYWAKALDQLVEVLEI